MTTHVSRLPRISARACDGCKWKRKKCEIAPEDESTTAEKRASQCARCLRLGLRCTYDTSPKTRGRKRKPTEPNPCEVNAHRNSATSPIRPASERHLNVDVPVALTTTSSSPYGQRMNGSYIQTEELHGMTPVANSPDTQCFLNALSPNSSVYPSQHPTDDLCSRTLFNQILDDYLHYIYPLVPLVHRPSLLKDFRQSRDVRDKDFHSLLCGLCGMVISILPRRFKAYKQHVSGLKFHKRIELLNHCYNSIMGNRGPEYFNEINHCKWAIAYSMRIAFYHIGEHNRSRMMDVEAMQIARLLCFHVASEYEGLNHIETQLRKKAFWLVFYSYVHNALQSLRKERMSYLDPDMLEILTLSELLPLEVDDEFIHEERVIPQPPSKPCIVTGFVVHSRVFWAALRSTQVSNDSHKEETCYCHRAKHPQVQFAHLKSRLRELKYMLDDIQPKLRQWAAVDENVCLGNSSTESHRIESQFAIMRANIHSTHIWLQSILLDQLDILLQNKELVIQATSSFPKDHLAVWTEREELSRQLLHVLHNIPQQYLEPNGLNITEKIRDVAVSLLSSPYEPEDEPSRRATTYVRDFADVMARFELDPIHTSNTQSWIDTDRFVSSHRLADIPTSTCASWS